MTRNYFVRSTVAVLTSLLLGAPAFANDEPPEPVPLPVQAPVPERPPALVPLYVSFAALQAADVATTLHNVNGGAVEANPLMGGVVRSPAGFVATKAALATVSIYCAEKLWKKNRAAAIALMVGLNGLSAVVVARNYSTGHGK